MDDTTQDCSELHDMYLSCSVNQMPSRIDAHLLGSITFTNAVNCVCVGSASVIPPAKFVVCSWFARPGRNHTRSFEAIITKILPIARTQMTLPPYGSCQPPHLVQHGFRRTGQHLPIRVQIRLQRIDQRRSHYRTTRDTG